MGNTAGTLQEAGVVYLSWAAVFTAGIWWDLCCSSF